MAIDLTLAMIAATVQIDQPMADGQREVGTGFLVNAPLPDGSPRTVLVTAGHVFDNMPGPAVSIGYRFQGSTGGWGLSRQPLAVRADARPLWTRNPAQDVAVIAIEAPPEFARAAIPLAWLADEAAFRQAGLEAGDEMFVLGFPKGFASNAEGFPILRAGRVASYPLTPIAEFPIFLLDFHVLGGNSGGPVFMAPGAHRAPGLPDVQGGFVAGVLTKQTQLELGVVVDAAFIRQTIAQLDQPPPSPEHPAPIDPAPPGPVAGAAGARP